ncbi:MAG: DUF2341 domain-containing protein [Candidatus Firestonebacteria bacterium]|nr:DUF2341 domain-containing protein [Candidatus Firestonebacteria bacterium]
MRKIGLVLSVMAITASPAWGAWLGNYAYRLPITIAHTKVTATLTDFPVLITGANLPAAFFGHVVQTDPANMDIAFTDVNGTELSREIVSFSSGGHSLEAWVKIPTLSSNSDTIIYMYYGDAAATRRNDPSTWSNGFAGVWHMEEGESPLRDSSPQANSGTAYGNLPTPINAKVGLGQDFDGRTGYVNCGLGQNNSLNIAGNNSLTIETWVQFNRLPAEQFMDFLCKGNHQWKLQKYSTSHNINFLVYDPFVRVANSDAGVSVTTWYHVVGRYDYAGGGEVALFLNGVKQGVTATAATISDDGAVVTLGQNAQASNRFLRGDMDEVRIQTIARSDAWIVTTYNNENSPATFYAAGSETLQPTPTSTLTATRTFTATNTPTFTPTGTITATPTSTSTFTPSPTVSTTATVSPTAGIPSPTCTPTVSATTTPAPFLLNGRGVVAFPNPARQSVTFVLDVPREGKVRVDIFNLKGERITALSQACGPGLVYLPWHCALVAPGVYLVRADLEGTLLGKTKVAIVGDTW